MEVDARRFTIKSYILQLHILCVCVCVCVCGGGGGGGWIMFFLCNCESIVE